MNKCCDIAIIGVGFKIPGASDFDEFEDILVSQKNVHSALPKGRLNDLRKIFKLQNKELNSDNFIKAAFLEEIDGFDDNIFNRNKKEIELIDPNHRIFLMTVFEALMDAGLFGSQRSLKDDKMGVFVGKANFMEKSYFDLLTKASSEDASIAVVDNLTAAIASRISYLFDFHGPNMTIDTTCSSSMVALAEAIKSINSGECDKAVVGGVNLQISPEKTEVQLGIESSSDKTESYGHDSCGTTVGEGSIAIIIQSMDKAIQEKANIYAVIKGISVNHTGKAASISAPNPESLSDNIIQAWDMAGIDPEQIDFIEGHGTGTILGDPIEVKALDRSFLKYTKKKQFCSLGSVKSNYGHLLDASGMLGLLKAILQIREHTIYPVANFKAPNQYFQICNTALVVSDQLTHKDYNRKMLGCVNCIGMTGTNVHVVLEEYKTDQTSECACEKRLFCYEAASEKSLLKMIEKNYLFLKNNSEVDLCRYAASLSRDYFKNGFEVKVYAESRDELCNKLLDILCGGSLAETVQGCSDDTVLTNVELEPRIHVPFYPFDISRYWINQNDKKEFSNENKDNKSVIEIIENILRDDFEIDNIDRNQSLFKMGLESVSLLKLTQQLSKYGFELPFIKIYEYNTIKKLEDYLNGCEVNGKSKTVEYKETTKQDDIAIVGMDCVVSNMKDKDELFFELLNKHDSIREFPKRRIEEVKFLSYNNDSQFKKGGFLETISNFDYSFFGITYKEACLMDPMQRLLLQSAYHCIEDSNLNIQQLSGRKVGVYIGASQNIVVPYAQLIYRSQPEDVAQATIGNISSMLSGRISHYFDFKGPSCTIDTACSSSMMALETAVRALRENVVDMAIVGGIHIDLYPENCGSAEIEAEDGRTHTFSDDATGTGFGEGVATILLQRNQDVSKNREIYAVIENVVANSDGHTPSVTYPNMEAQCEMLRKVYKEIDVDQLAAIEAHGTGTLVGDLIEFQALQDGIGINSDSKQMIGITGIKSNIGHLYEAAGIVSVIKAALSLKNGVIPCVQHLRIPNSEMNLTDSAFFLLDQNYEIPDERRYIGISSFGFSGTNVHALIKRKPVSQKTLNAVEFDKYYIRVSAKTKLSLKHMLMSWLKYVTETKNIDSTNFYDLQCTTIFDRELFDYCIAFEIKSYEELHNLLIDSIVQVDQMNFGNSKRIVVSMNDAKGVRITIVEDIKIDLCDNKEVNIFSSKECANDEFEENYRHIKIPLYKFETNPCWVKTNVLYDVKRKDNVSELDVNSLSTREIILIIYKSVFGSFVDDEFDFYQMGGDSLTAITICNEAKKYQLELNIADVMSWPTIKSLETLVKETKNSSDKLQLSKATEKDYYPVADVQKSFYMKFLMQTDADSQIGVGIRFGEIIDYSTIQHKIECLVNNYDVFHATFEMKDGEIVMKNNRIPKYRLEYAECADDEAYCTEQKKFLQPIAIDTQSGVAFKVCHLMSKKETVLLIGMHHIISDWMSVGILANSFSQLMKGNKLDRLSYDYFDYSEWNREFQKTDDYKKHLDYWKGQVEQFDFSQSICLYEEEEPSEGYQYSFTISGDSYVKIQELTKSVNATVAEVLFTLIYIVLRKKMGNSSCVLGMPVSGRVLPETEKIPGLFMNTISLMLDYKGEEEFNKIIEYVKNKLNNAMVHQMISIDDVVQYAKQHGGLTNIEKYFSMIVAVQNIRLKEEGLNSFALKDDIVSNIAPEFIVTDKELIFQVDIPVKSSKYDLYIEIFDLLKEKINEYSMGKEICEFEEGTDIMDEFDFSKIGDV